MAIPIAAIHPRYEGTRAGPIFVRHAWELGSRLTMQEPAASFNEGQLR